MRLQIFKLLGDLWQGHDLRLLLDGHVESFYSVTFHFQEDLGGILFLPYTTTWSDMDFKPLSVHVFDKAFKKGVPCYTVYVDRSGEPGIYELDSDMKPVRGTRNKLFESNPTFIQTSYEYEVE